MHNLNSHHFSKMQTKYLFLKILRQQLWYIWTSEMGIFLIVIDNGLWKKSNDDTIMYVYVSRYNSATYPNQWHNILVFYQWLLKFTTQHNLPTLMTLWCMFTIFLNSDYIQLNFGTSTELSYFTWEREDVYIFWSRSAEAGVILWMPYSIMVGLQESSDQLLITLDNMWK